MGIQLRKLAYKIINLSTKLLPAWKSLLRSLKVAERLMLRDVRTCWNSTFLMLDLAITHWKALDLLSGDRDNGLREFELNERDWKLAEQLRDVLKVRLALCL
jgi:hypothetical protein